MAFTTYGDAPTDQRWDTETRKMHSQEKRIPRSRFTAKREAHPPRLSQYFSREQP